MHLVHDAHDFVVAWVAQRLQIRASPATAIGVVHRSRLVAGVVYSEYRDCDICMSCASEHPRWLSQERLRAIFAYPFVQLGVARVTAVTDKRNKHSRRFIERIGFHLEGVHPRAMDDGGTACSYGMLREDCRWIRSAEHGQEKQPLTAAGS